MVPEHARPAGRGGRVERVVLRGGLGLALVLMASGLALRVAASDLWAEGIALPHLLAARHPGDGLMALGILVLAVVPPLRVASLLALWSRERDRRFVAVAVAVIAVLALALVAGEGG